MWAQISRSYLARKVAEWDPSSAYTAHPQILLCLLFKLSPLHLASRLQRPFYMAFPTRTSCRCMSDELCRSLLSVFQVHTTRLSSETYGAWILSISSPIPSREVTLRPGNASPEIPSLYLPTSESTGCQTRVPRSTSRDRSSSPTRRMDLSLANSTFDCSDEYSASTSAVLGTGTSESG